jgi:spermidine/putrescine transport system permease protein
MKNIIVEGHRGYCAKYPENTLISFEAALDLGCTPRQAFFKVIMPAINPGIVSGLLMAFTLSLDDFVISYYTSAGFQTLPIKIFSMTKRVVKPDMYALSTIIFLTILVLLVTINILQARSEEKLTKK